MAVNQQYLSYRYITFYNKVKFLYCFKEELLVDEKKISGV